VQVDLAQSQHPQDILANPFTNPKSFGQFHPEVGDQYLPRGQKFSMNSLFG
jgi:hypothetical protein